MNHAIHYLGCWLGLGLAGCVDHRDDLTGTQSIGVTLVAPASPGDLQNRLPDGLRAITVNLTAYDADHEIDPSFDRDVQVYVQYLGTLTPALGAKPPLTTIHMTAGQAMAQTIMIPPVYGPTTLWFDDGQDAHPTYATGTSPILWYREPYIADIQTPLDEKKLDALLVSPLQNKQITVRTSRYGDVGRLVVTSVFAQGYTLSDVQCSDAAGTPPCVTNAYDHVEVFSFSAPRGQDGKLLQQGQAIDGFSGAVSEFNGLTEIGFPVTFATGGAVVPERQPRPVVLDKDTWFNALGDPQGIINFERNEAAPIEIDNAKVCMLDGDYVKFQQWKLDPRGAGGNCVDNLINVITAGVTGIPDPATLVDKILPRVVGVLRPVEFQSFNVWIIFPRSAADVTLP